MVENNKNNKDYKSEIKSGIDKMIEQVKNSTIPEKDKEKFIKLNSQLINRLCKINYI